MHSEKGNNDSLDLIIKMTEFAKTAALDVETIVQEQLKDPVIDSVNKRVKKLTKRETKPHRPRDKAIRLIFDSLIYYSSKIKSNYCVFMNITMIAPKPQKHVYHHHYFLTVST